MDVPEQAYIDGTLGVYELNQIDLLRDVFAWAYERSCQHYLAITANMVTPDPIQVRYRMELIEAVQEIVRNLQTPTLENIQPLADRLIQKGKDRAQFTELVRNNLKHLHADMVAVFRLKVSEFLAWEAKQGDHR